MNWDEYNKLFHELELNLVAFKPLMQCDQEVLRLVNAALVAERDACAKIVEQPWQGHFREVAEQIRARGQSEVS